MILLDINNVDRTEDLTAGTLSITNQIQQRSDNCNFELFQGVKPSENQGMRIFCHDTIASFAGRTVMLNGFFQRNIGMFYAGQTLSIRINDADEEEVTVESYNETTLQIVLVAAPSGSVVAGDKIGALIFGGLISRVVDKNVHSLNNIEYEIECVCFTKIFDKKLIADSWQDKDSRYIINDFCNSTVNYNSTIDDLSYDNNTDIQAEWIESQDGNNPTVDTSDFLEGAAAGVFSWTHTGTASAKWAGSPISSNVANLTGANTGTPTKGALMCWVEAADYTKITSLKIRIGSSAADYAEVTIPVTSNVWAYHSVDLDTATIGGTPDWTALDYAQIIVAENASSSIKINGIRINAQNSFTLYNVQSTPTFDDMRAAQQKPTAFMQLLSKTWDFLWYVDYVRDVHFVPIENDASPFNLSDSSNNFYDLKMEVDQSQMGNRILVRGGEQTSDNYYSEVKQGDNAAREWVLKTKFNNLSVVVDDNGTTHAAEATTSTTNIKITAHGLATGDHIVNRSRSNAVRSITVVDANNFTVETVPSQTSGDTISFFAVTKLVGIEGIDDETAFQYMYNSNSQSVRSSNTYIASPGEPTLTTASFIQFKYKERLNIQFQYTDFASVNALKALGFFGDGIVDLDPYTDKNIDSLGTAIAIAQAKVGEFSNAVVTGTFRTDQFGLKAGQIMRITDSVRGIDVSYVIQRINKRQTSGQYNDYFSYSVTVGTTLFGYIEFFQKLLATQDRIEQNINDPINTFVSSEETVESSDVNAVALNGGFLKVAEAETVTSDDADLVYVKAKGTWQYEPSVGQTLPTRFNLADYG